MEHNNTKINTKSYFNQFIIWLIIFFLNIFEFVFNKLKIPKKKFSKITPLVDKYDCDKCEYEKYDYEKCEYEKYDYEKYEIDPQNLTNYLTKINKKKEQIGHNCPNVFSLQ